MTPRSPATGHIPGDLHVIETSMQCLIRAENFEETFTNVAVTPGLNRNARGNARRLVACWNAMQHFSTEQIESGRLRISLPRVK